MKLLNLKWNLKFINSNKQKYINMQQFIENRNLSVEQ
jgi:hypothetical protein